MESYIDSNGFTHDFIEDHISNGPEECGEDCMNPLRDKYVLENKRIEEITSRIHLDKYLIEIIWSDA